MKKKSIGLRSQTGLQLLKTYMMGRT